MTLDMTKKAALVSLEKAMTVSMEKGNDLGEVGLSFEWYCDWSGSMSRRFQGDPSEMQTVMERVLAMVLTGLDDDGKVPGYTFGATLRDIGEITEENYKHILSEQLRDHPLEMDTILQDVVDQVKRNEPSDAKNQLPRVIIVDTDAQVGSREAKNITKQIAKYSKEPVFWIFIGHGASLKWLRELDTMDGRKVDNVALVEVENAASMSDEQFYDAFTGELLTSWLPAARAAGITNK